MSCGKSVIAISRLFPQTSSTGEGRGVVNNGKVCEGKSDWVSYCYFMYITLYFNPGNQCLI